MENWSVNMQITVQIIFLSEMDVNKVRYQIEGIGEIIIW